MLMFACVCVCVCMCVCVYVSVCLTCFKESELLVQGICDCDCWLDLVRDMRIDTALEALRKRLKKKKGKKENTWACFVCTFQSEFQTLLLWNCDVCIHACTNLQIQVCMFVRVCCACLFVRVRVMICMREREKVCVFLWYLKYRKEPHTRSISACVCHVKANWSTHLWN